MECAVIATLIIGSQRGQLDTLGCAEYTKPLLRNTENTIPAEAMTGLNEPAAGEFMKRGTAMGKVVLCKASPIIESEPVADAVLEFSEKLPENLSLSQQEELFKDQAMKIRDVLFNHVAQGVRHQLLILLLSDVKDLYIGAR
jgi:hypothetical protein